MLTLTEINESLLFEWWAQDVAKSMKKKGTVGAFTQQCKDMGFNKSSLACIKHVENEYKKAKELYAAGKMNKKEYDEWALKKKRATLAKTFKKWGSKKKKENKMRLENLTESKKIEIDEQKLKELVRAAIAVNLSVPLNYSNELNGKLNKLEKAIKNIGFNPRDNRL